MFGKKPRHKHHWETVSQIHRDFEQYEITMWGERILTKKGPQTVYTIRCTECGDISQRVVDGYQPAPRHPGRP